MIEGDGYAKPVLFGEVHGQSGKIGIIDNVMVREHDRFRKTGGAGGVLNVYHVVSIERCGMFIQLR